MPSLSVFFHRIECYAVPVCIFLKLRMASKVFVLRKPFLPGELIALSWNYADKEEYDGPCSLIGKGYFLLCVKLMYNFFK